MTISFTVPPQNAGQIVEVAYAVTTDWTYRRTTDRSDGLSVFYDRTEADGDGPELEEDDWTPCESPEEDR